MSREIELGSPYPTEKTLAIIQDGSHFYGTASELEPDADVDLIFIELAKTRDIFTQNTKAMKTRQFKFRMWGKKFDVKVFELDQYLEQIIKGNVQFIEKIEYLSSSILYNNSIWDRLSSKICRLAEVSLYASNFGHIFGWAKNTLDLIDKNGLNVKRGLLLYRILTTAKKFAEGQILCAKFPVIISYCPKHHKNWMEQLYGLRMGIHKKEPSSSECVLIEDSLKSYLDEVVELVKEKLPVNQKNKMYIPVLREEIIYDARKMAIERDK